MRIHTDRTRNSNYAFNPIAEQALGSKQTIVPQRVNAALDLMTSLLEFRRSIEESPSWRRVLSGIVGGLTEVGLSKDESYLLVVSYSGRGLYDLIKGLRVARDGSAPALSSPWISEAKRLVRGIGPRADEWFECAGLWGGALESSLGADVSVEVSGEGDVGVALLRDGDWVWEVTKVNTEMRVFGFSGSGNLLVLAASGEVCVFERVRSHGVEVQLCNQPDAGNIPSLNPGTTAGAGYCGVRLEWGESRDSGVK